MWLSFMWGSTCDARNSLDRAPLKGPSISEALGGTIAVWIGKKMGDTGKDEYATGTRTSESRIYLTRSKAGLCPFVRDFELVQMPIVRDVARGDACSFPGHLTIPNRMVILTA